MERLYVLDNGVARLETDEEYEKRIAQAIIQNEQEQLDKLKPSQEEVEQAEFELKTINLLTELEVI